jgi:hypothetical protein
LILLKLFILGSFSADQPLSIDFNQASDDLQPCIEDIRHEIDRLRREEQLLRERFEIEKLTNLKTREKRRIPRSAFSPLRDPSKSWDLGNRFFLLDLK